MGEQPVGYPADRGYEVRARAWTPCGLPQGRSPVVAMACGGEALVAAGDDRYRALASSRCGATPGSRAAATHGRATPPGRAEGREERGLDETVPPIAHGAQDVALQRCTAASVPPDAECLLSGSGDSQRSVSVARACRRISGFGPLTRPRGWETIPPPRGDHPAVPVGTPSDMSVTIIRRLPNWRSVALSCH